MIILENNHFKASFAKKGAELQSILNKNNNLDYLWNGDPAYWGKFSPVLFPIVGALKDDTYHYQNKEYTLPRHGFARDYEFQANQVDNEEVIFTLTQNEETLKVYPFQFILQLQYKLTESGLSCTYHVINPHDHTMLFSIGAHPAFKVPLDSALDYSDYFLEFNKDTMLPCHKINNNLIANETFRVELDNQRLNLSHDLFYNDALVIKALKSDCIAIRSDSSPNGLHFKFQDFPFFGIWAAKDANFLCLEPWCGIADGKDHSKELEEKEGIIHLGSTETWTRTWEVECF